MDLDTKVAQQLGMLTLMVLKLQVEVEQLRAKLAAEAAPKEG